MAEIDEHPTHRIARIICSRAEMKSIVDEAPENSEIVLLVFDPDAPRNFFLRANDGMGKLHVERLHTLASVFAREMLDTIMQPCTCDDDEIEIDDDEGDIDGCAA